MELFKTAEKLQELETITRLVKIKSRPFVSLFCNYDDVYEETKNFIAYVNNRDLPYHTDYLHNSSGYSTMIESLGWRLDLSSAIKSQLEDIYEYLDLCNMLIKVIRNGKRNFLQRYYSPEGKGGRKAIEKLNTGSNYQSCS